MNRRATWQIAFSAAGWVREEKERATAEASPKSRLPSAVGAIAKVALGPASSVGWGSAWIDSKNAAEAM